MKLENNKHGGIRTNAGRKPTGKMNFSLRLKTSFVDEVGANRIRKEILNYLTENLGYYE